LIFVSASVSTKRSSFISKGRHSTECHRHLWSSFSPNYIPLFTTDY